MLRWLGPKKAQANSPGHAETTDDGEVTDDPLAAIGPSGQGQQIYAVSRINPLYVDCVECDHTPRALKKPKSIRPKITESPPRGGQRSNSSGYGSSQDPLYADIVKLRDAILEHNPEYVKAIHLTTKGSKERDSASSSSGGGSLTAIPEGQADLSIPRPVWPYKGGKQEVQARKDYFDSLVDETLLLYTSLNFTPDSLDGPDSGSQRSIREVLVDLLNNINATIEGRTGFTPEEMLKFVNDTISQSLEALKLSTEEEVKNLCVNLSNRKKVNSVIRALNNSSSSSGNSSRSSPEFSGERVRTLSTDTDEISGSSSSGFSDINRLPVFVHEDLSSVPNGVRNAMIYGTLCRNNVKTEKIVAFPKDNGAQKKKLLQPDDSKPSVWEQYYGISAVPDGGVKYAVKPTDVPLFPGGRPEADFTLDVPRSELLSKKMKKDKKWRCRCRVLTSFLGLVFFLLSVMTVSLILTRGKRMFGSMV